MAERVPAHNHARDDIPAGWGQGHTPKSEELAAPEGAAHVGYDDLLVPPLLGADTVQEAIDVLKGGGGGGSAPNNATYLTLSLDAGLTNERVFTTGLGLTFTDNGAGSTYVLDSTTWRVYAPGIVGLVTPANQVVIGAVAPVGAEALRVTGDVLIEGKLTVTGIIDPTAVLLSDPLLGTVLYFDSADGQTAPVAPLSHGRLRYNNATLRWEGSVNGGAYTGFGPDFVPPPNTYFVDSNLLVGDPGRRVYIDGDTALAAAEAQALIDAISYTIWVADASGASFDMSLNYTGNFEATFTCLSTDRGFAFLDGVPSVGGGASLIFTNVNVSFGATFTGVSHLVSLNDSLMSTDLATVFGTIFFTDCDARSTTITAEAVTGLDTDFDQSNANPVGLVASWVQRGGSAPNFSGFAFDTIEISGPSNRLSNGISFLTSALFVNCAFENSSGGTTQFDGGGVGDITLVNCSLRGISDENGSITLFDVNNATMDDFRVAVIANYGTVNGTSVVNGLHFYGSGYPQVGWPSGTLWAPLFEETFRVPATPNTAQAQYWAAPFNLAVREIKVFAATAPTSAAGTYLLTITGAGNNLLFAASFNLETLGAGVLTDITLTIVPGDLNLTADDIVVVTATSNNADLTGGDGLFVQLIYSQP